MTSETEFVSPIPTSSSSTSSSLSSSTSTMSHGLSTMTTSSTNAVKDFANTHRVKKLLETYIDSAGRSLTGPSGIEEAQQLHQKWGGTGGTGGGVAYKLPFLPPDVELSKSVEEVSKFPRSRSASPSFPSSSSINNGMVTLSRIDDGSPPLRPHYQQQRPHHYYHHHHHHPHHHRSSGGSRGERHLSGEMIRRILERQKAVDKQDTTVIRPKEQLKQFKSPPMLIARDRGVSEFSESIIWGEKIACFNVGGERRCCLPQILNSVLDSVSLQAINTVCDDLQIYCSTCTVEQLEVLKAHKIIPITAGQCGLITKSDAERVCSVLLDRNPPRASMSAFHAKASPFSFKVQHDCFGRNFGIVLPEAYTNADAKCIECLECEGLFSPQKFVCHAHFNAEKRTCHWGFDSENWRTYLRLADSYTEDEMLKYEKVFKDFKERYSSSSSSNNASSSVVVIPPVASKRKEEPEDVDESVASHAKKSRIDDTTLPFSPYNNIYNLYNSWAAAVSKGYPTANAAAAAAWTNSLAAAFKEGKVPPVMGFPGINPLAARAANLQQRLLEVKQEEIKVGYSSSQQQPQPLHQHHQQHHHHQQQQQHPPPPPPPPPPPLPPPSLPPTRAPSAPQQQMSERKKDESSDSFSTSLAEDINAIRESLEGASTIARERTLKTLERITARLAQTEMERDIAVANLNELQRRYRSTEEELRKKRGELRELLTQDHNERPAVTLELLSGGGKTTSTIASTSSSATVVASSTTTTTNTLLPKIDVKSPSRVVEERERSSSTTSSLTAKRNSPSPTSPTNSNKSKESEDLRDRMVTMEAELRALREELTNRSSVTATTSEDESIEIKSEKSS